MSTRKFFSFLHSQEVHIAPETKVLPSETFSTLLSAEEVLKKAKEDALHYRSEVVAEIEALKEKAQKEGFEQGFSQWVKAIADLEEEIIKNRKETEKAIVPIALKAAKKIVGEQLKVSEDAIIDIISNSLKAVAQHKKITIWVNPKELEIVQSHKDKIKKQFENLEVLSIRPRNDITEGGCLIETEVGIINAQLENQWLILENAFNKLMKNIPEEKGKKKS